MLLIYEQRLAAPRSCLHTHVNPECMSSSKLKGHDTASEATQTLYREAVTMAGVAGLVSARLRR